MVFRGLKFLIFFFVDQGKARIGIKDYRSLHLGIAGIHQQKTTRTLLNISFTVSPQDIF